MLKFLVRIRSVIIGCTIGFIIGACATIPRGELTQSAELDCYKALILNMVAEHCTPDQWHSKIPMTIGFSEGDQFNDSIAVTRTRYNIFLQPTSFRLGFDPVNWQFSNHADKTQLMAHELMHAIFGESDWREEKDKYHFMYWSQYYLPLETILEQIHVYLKEKCE